MAYQETLPRIRVPRKAMMKRVARFSKLKGFDGGQGLLVSHRSPP